MIPAENHENMCLSVQVMYRKLMTSGVKTKRELHQLQLRQHCTLSQN